MHYYKFVTWEIPEVETVLTGRLPQALKAYDEGNKQPLKDMHIATEHPIYKIMGWAFPFREYMRKFWVKTKYYGILEIYAMNKTDIRKEYRHTGVIKIVEIKD